jgi:phosphoribosyl 1,2-cyclic phosphodiesterase
MFTVHPLYSSSSGNMFHIASSNTNILIDVGVSYKAINEGLKSIGLTIKDIDAVLITHEHSDHIKGLPLLCRKNEIPIYACLNTADYIKEDLNSKNIESKIIALEYNKPIKIKDVEICAFETSHDAVMPCGYILKDDVSTITFATDLGYVSPTVYDSISKSDYTILESNYDNAMLEFGKYPFSVKRRIKGLKGHLSNDDCGQAIAKLVNDEGQTRFLLAHMSENNNNIDIAKQTVESILTQNGIDLNSVEINFASKNLSSEGYTIC